MRSPRDIVAVVFSDGERWEVRGDSPLHRLAHLADAVDRLQREWILAGAGLDPATTVPTLAAFSAIEAEESKSARLARFGEARDTSKTEGEITRRLVLKAIGELQAAQVPKRKLAAEAARSTGVSAPRIRQILRKAEKSK